MIQHRISTIQFILRPVVPLDSKDVICRILVRNTSSTSLCLQRYGHFQNVKSLTDVKCKVSGVISEYECCVTDVEVTGVIITHVIGYFRK